MRKLLITFIGIMLLSAGCNLVPVNKMPSQKTNSTPTASSTWDGGLVLYHSDDCSHCREIINHIKSTGIDKKLDLSYVEVSSEEGYRNFYEKVQACDIPIYQIGVPMMWDGSQCYKGVDQIKEELGYQMMQE